jgi:hypothetical protein
MLRSEDVTAAACAANWFGEVENEAKTWMLMDEEIFRKKGTRNENKLKTEMSLENGAGFKNI